MSPGSGSVRPFHMPVAWSHASVVGTYVQPFAYTPAPLKPSQIVYCAGGRRAVLAVELARRVAEQPQLLLRREHGRPGHQRARHVQFLHLLPARGPGGGRPPRAHVGSHHWLLSVDAAVSGAGTTGVALEPPPPTDCSALFSITFTKRSLNPPRNAATTNVANSLPDWTCSRLLCRRKYNARPK